MTPEVPKILNDTFLHWVVEREKARLHKAGIGPGSSDHIVQQYRFCNVSREDDRTTIWIKENIRDPFDKDAEDKDLLLALCLARFINLPETLGELAAAGVLSTGGISLSGVCETVSARQERGEKSFSAAYMVRSETNKESKTYGVGKIAYIAAILENVKMPDCSSRQSFVETLTAQYGFGDFMSGQVAADAAYTRLLRDAPDHMTWAPIGPGAVRGMNRALGRNINKSISEEEYLLVGREQLHRIPREIREGRKLTLHDVASNVNCETDKYLRIKYGQGHTRRYQ